MPTSVPQYDCRLLPQDNNKLWDDLVVRSRYGTVFHQTHWLGAFNKPFAVIGCYDKEDELVGGMPLSYEKVVGFTIARPPYLTPYLGPASFRTEGQNHRILTLEKNIALTLIEFARSFCDFIRIPLSPGYGDTQPFRQNGFAVDIEYTYVADLDDMDSLWKGLDQDKRRKVRKGYAEGLVLELSDDLGNFIPLWAHSLSVHNKYISPARIREVQSWYRGLVARNQAKLLLLRNARAEVSAGAILVWDRARAYYLLSGMNRDIASANCMALLVWECMRFAKEEIGVMEFDFDGSDVPSVEIFFRGFGGRLLPRYSVMWGRPWIQTIRKGWQLVCAVTS